MKINSKLMGFGAGTQILMADGSHKAIENIKTGDMVLSFNQLDAFGQLEPKRVLNTYMRVDRNPLKVTVPDTEIELLVAPGQLFINSSSNWKEASNINEIIDNTGNVYKFDVNQITRGKHQMFDIIVEDNHSLIANGVRVHNMTYSVEDVKQGRADPGRSSNYYRRDDLENHGDSYQHGKSKKKKGKRKGRDNRPEIKVDGTITASKLLSSIEDLTDVISEIVEETTPANLTPIKLTMQNSVDSIVNYMASYINSIVNASMSTYDKSEILSMAGDFTFAAGALRKPFEETVVSTGGKLIAMNQLATMDILIVRMFRILEDYTGPADEDTGLFNVELDGQNTLSSKKKRFKASRAANGQYQEGGSRSDVGGNSSRGSNRGTSGSGPGPNRNTNPNKTPGQRVTQPGGRGGPPRPTPRPGDLQTRPQGRGEVVGNNRSVAPPGRGEVVGNNYSTRQAANDAYNGYKDASQNRANRVKAEQSSRALGGYGNYQGKTGGGMSYTGGGGNGSSNAHGGQSRSSPGQGGVNRSAEATRAGNGGGGLGSPGTRSSTGSGNPANSGSGSNPTSGPSSRSSSSSRSTGSGCFAYGTLFKMADGSIKAIQDIVVGDIMLEGGKVYQTFVGDGSTSDWYIYNNVKVTGTHPVLDIDNTWKRVADSVNSIPTTTNELYYTLNNENNRMIAYNNTRFTDFLEVGFDNPLRKTLYGVTLDNLIKLLNNESVTV